MKIQASKMGRPSKYNSKIVLDILQLATEGVTDAAICKKLKLAIDTVWNWKKKYPDFSEALKKARDIADEQVVATLRMKALGYEKPAVKFFFDSESKEVITHSYNEYIHPDTTSIIFWLKNRQPQEWRDVQRKEVTGLNGTALPAQVVFMLPPNGSESND